MIEKAEIGKELFLLFESFALPERGYMEATDLMQCGTPIDTDGDDMILYGWTTSENDADAWIMKRSIDNV